MSSYMHIVGKRKRRAAFLFLRIWASFCAKPQFCIASLSKRYLQISQFYKWQASDLCTIYPLKNNKRLWTKIQGSNTILIWHKIITYFVWHFYKYQTYHKSDINLFQSDVNVISFMLTFKRWKYRYKIWCHTKHAFLIIDEKPRFVVV